MVHKATDFIEQQYELKGAYISDNLILKFKVYTNICKTSSSAAKLHEIRLIINLYVNLPQCQKLLMTWLKVPEALPLLS